MKHAVIQAPSTGGAVKPKDRHEVRSKAEAFLGSLQATV